MVMNFYLAQNFKGFLPEVFMRDARLMVAHGPFPGELAGERDFLL
jgi:hypothetical protein